MVNFIVTRFVGLFLPAALIVFVAYSGQTDVEKQNTKKHVEQNAVKENGQSAKAVFVDNRNDAPLSAVYSLRKKLNLRKNLNQVKKVRAYGMPQEEIDNVPLPTGQARVVRSPGKVEVYSPLFLIDRVYKSMEGPDTDHSVRLVETDKPELVWITGCHAEMVDEHSSKTLSPEYMCHANLDIDTEKHSEIFGEGALDGRMFTLSQGQLNVQFPKGFGIPIRSDEPITLALQVLNLNIKNANLRLRHHVTITFVRESELKQKYRPLFESGIFAMKSLEGTQLVYDSLQGKHTNESLCLPGQLVNDWDVDEDAYGRKFTGHWVINPGREINRTRVTTLLNVPYDTTIHYIAVHLHPFAESLELRDLTTGKTIFKSVATNFKNRIGLKNVEAFSSEEGFAVFEDHEYELVSIYNNRSKVKQDSMAVMYVYMQDKEFNARRADLKMAKK